jgi:hypothetical protein
MRESRTYGSVRGARGNSRPYRDRFARNDGGRGSHCAVMPSSLMMRPHFSASRTVI